MKNRTLTLSLFLSLTVGAGLFCGCATPGEPSTEDSKSGEATTAEAAASEDAAAAAKTAAAAAAAETGPAQPSAQAVFGPQKEDIRQVIKDHTPQLSECYNKAVKVRPGLRGKVVVQWTIDDKGAAREAEILQSSVPSSLLSECLLEQVQSWQFKAAAPQATTQVVYPFIFSADGAPRK